MWSSPVRSFEQPPPGLVAVASSELWRYGLPPLARDLLCDLAKIQYITPKIAPYCRTLVAGNARVASDTEAHVDATSHNWAGSIVHAGENFASISGSWIVPKVGSGQPQAHASMWVGLGGDTGSESVVQAGTDVSEGGYTAWCEWYPDESVRVVNFPVAPGDEITTLLFLVDQNEAWFHMTNVTANVHQAMSLSKPKDAQNTFNSAEAIVERPNIDGKFVPLASFGEVVFTKTIATSASGLTYDISLGNPLTMVDDKNKPLAQPNVTTGPYDSLTIIRTP